MAALFTLRMRLPPGVDASAALGGLALDDDASASGHAPRGDGEEASSTSSAPGRVLAFSAGNPRADVISGRIHLYRDAAADAPGGAGAASPAPSRRGDALPAGRQPLVCVLAVPSSLSISDFCQFAAALLPKVVEMRVVRSEGEGEGEGAGAGAGAGNDGSAAGFGSGSGAGNDGSAAGSGSGSGARDAPRALAPSTWYSVLMRFEDQDAADAFALNYHNRRFNSFVEGTCTALFVRRVEMDPRPPSSSPSSSSSAPPPPPAGAVELPSCPVCLDRLDQDVSGVVTTVCAHSFHHACLSKWGDSSCPVCRYTQRPEDAARCHECGSTEELWACLVCGVVGCGRYAGGCAVAHWKQTDHCYSLELATQRVWDYVRDGFVHRLIQSKTGLVELAPGRRRRGGARRARASGGAGTSTAATGEEAGARRGRGARGSGVGLGGELGGELGLFSAQQLRFLGGSCSRFFCASCILLSALLRMPITCLRCSSGKAFRSSSLIERRRTTVLMLASRCASTARSPVDLRRTMETKERMHSRIWLAWHAAGAASALAPFSSCPSTEKADAASGDDCRLTEEGRCFFAIGDVGLPTPAGRACWHRLGARGVEGVAPRLHRAPRMASIAHAAALPRGRPRG